VILGDGFRLRSQGLVAVSLLQCIVQEMAVIHLEQTILQSCCSISSITFALPCMHASWVGGELCGCVRVRVVAITTGGVPLSMSSTCIWCSQPLFVITQGQILHEHDDESGTNNRLCVVIIIGECVEARGCGVCHRVSWWAMHAPSCGDPEPPVAAPWPCFDFTSCKHHFCLMLGNFGAGEGGLTSCKKKLVCCKICHTACCMAPQQPSFHAAAAHSLLTADCKSKMLGGGGLTVRG